MDLGLAAIKLLQFAIQVYYEFIGNQTEIVSEEVDDTEVPTDLTTA
jgi:hypothetical protein